MTTMYDSVTASSIPSSAAIVAGYVDGAYAWSQTDWALFPNAQHVTITVFGQPGAMVADCESGDLTPAQAAVWAAQEMAQGRHPTIYCSLAIWDSVKAACGPSITPDYWIADWTGVPHLVPGSVATQWTNGENYDTSETLPSWPTPVTPPVPPLPPGVTMSDITFGTASDPQGRERPAIFYPATGDRMPVMLVDQGDGTWFWYAMNDPKVVTNGAQNLPAVAGP